MYSCWQHDQQRYDNSASYASCHVCCGSNADLETSSNVANACCRTVDEELAAELREFRSPTDNETRMFYEIVIAPGYTPEGLAKLKGKSKTLRILEAPLRAPSGRSLRQVAGRDLASTFSHKLVFCLLQQCLGCQVQIVANRGLPLMHTAIVRWQVGYIQVFRPLQSAGTLTARSLPLPCWLDMQSRPTTTCLYYK